MRKNLSLYRLDDYGLTYSKFIRLKNLVRIRIDLKYPKQEKFFPFKPEDRRIKINEVLKKEYDKLVKILPHEKYRAIKAAKGFRGVEIVMLPHEVKKLENKNYIDSVWIEEIEGLKKKTAKKTLRVKKSWYNINAIFTIQIEGTKGGLQRYEERMLLVKAYDGADAERIAKREFKEYGEYIYLNENLQMVRWYFDKIIDIYEVDIFNDKPDPKGTEIYSRLRWRKFTPENEWYPIKKYKKI
jgi:hypothetical protein